MSLWKCGKPKKGEERGDTGSEAVQEYKRGKSGKLLIASDKTNPLLHRTKMCPVRAFMYFLLNRTMVRFSEFRTDLYEYLINLRTQGGQINSTYKKTFYNSSSSSNSSNTIDEDEEEIGMFFDNDNEE
jgi:hypothetical protein